MWNKIRYDGDANDVRELYREYEHFLETRLASEDQRKSDLRAELLQRGVLLSTALSPRIFQIAESVMAKLQVPGAFDVICVNEESINAFAAVESSTANSDQFIGITSGALEKLEDDELAFILGHEIGHILFRHSRLSGLMDRDPESRRLTVLPEMAESLFLRWQKKREISADRIGLRACESFEAAARALLKAGYGLSARNLNLDVTSLLQQLDDLRDDPAAVQSNFQSHPLLPIRLRALSLFDQLGDQPDQAAVDACDDAVDELFSWFKKYPRKPLDEAVMRILAIKGLELLRADQNHTFEEVRTLLYMLHECFTEEPEAEIMIEESERANRWNAAVEVFEKEGSPKHSIFIVSRLTEIAIADGKFAERETELILEVSKALGLRRDHALSVMVEAAQTLGFQQDQRMSKAVQGVLGYVSRAQL